MKKSWLQFTTILAFTLAAVVAHAGTISYVAIAPTQSDNNCGISKDHGYTTAVDGGNTRGTDRVVNGITLYALSGAGENSATADNCTVNALAGTLTDAGVSGKNVQADGALRDVLSDMVLNNAGGDNSQVEIVLDPESLEQGTTYDLRVYICSSSGQNRQVNLSFFGDGQNAAETGFFNEDDARTSAGKFQSPNQVYYINFRYTWDGDSTPGITITQKSGGAPFYLYALTNELVEEGGGAAGAQAAAGGAGGEAAGEGEEGGEDGLSSGYVENQESDEVGVESDDFYGSESLNSNGKWIKLSKWGTCWQPTGVQSGWSPYTNGSWKECDDCGWTFVSDEPWAWACYHYGRWCKVRSGCGWAWVPGKVWAASWVSWRQGRDESCNCLGWAPLPPEAGCQLGIGISSWVDSTCNIGPECYTFVNIRDFGSDSYWGCGCIYDRGRNSTIIIDTFNCTNICHSRRGTWCGGPDYNWCNTQIRKQGGKECGRIHVNRYDDPGKNGGKWAKHEGNQLGLVSPRIKGEKNPKHMPKTAESLGSDKIDHGWGKDKNKEREVKNHIAQENKGKNPRNSPAKLPSDVAQKLGKHGGRQAGGEAGAGGGAGNLHPGGKGKGKGEGQGQDLQARGGQGQGAGGFDQHPGKGKGKGKGQGQGQGLQAGGGQGQGAGGFDQHPGKGKGKGRGQGVQAGGGQGQGAGGFDQHPGKGKNRGRGQGANAGAGDNGSGGNQKTGMGQGGRGRHPGQSLKKQQGSQGGAGAESNMAQGAGDGQHPGKGKGKGRGKGGQGGQGGNEPGASGMPQTAGGAQGTGQGGGRGKGRHKQGQGQTQQGGSQQLQQSQGQAAAQGGGGGGGQGKGHRKQQQTQQSGQAQGQMRGQGGGGGQGRRQQQQAVQQQQYQRQQGGGGGGGGGGGKGRRAKPTPTPH
jgi:uncharacterized protein DUF6600